jgi:hypothetical protein
MVLLTSGTALAHRFGPVPWLGQLICPRSRNRVMLPQWAADNAAYSGFDPVGYNRMIDRIRLALPVTRPVFVAVPDVLGHAQQTRKQFSEWYPRLGGLPIAYILQDGEQVECVPWSLLTAVFVGGSTTFKTGRDARQLVVAAKARGLWVHMGRVNTVRRLLYAKQIGCDSVDGSGFAQFPDAMLPRFLRVNDNYSLNFQ